MRWRSYFRTPSSVFTNIPRRTDRLNFSRTSVERDMVLGGGEGGGGGGEGGEERKGRENAGVRFVWLFVSSLIVRLFIFV